MNFGWDDNKNALTDKEIDTSDIPPLDENFFANAELRLPKNKVSVLLTVDQETNDWYQSQGEEAKELMTAALKIYAEAHKEIHR